MTDTQTELQRLEARLDRAIAHDSGETLTADEIDRLFALRRQAARKSKPTTEEPPVSGAQRIARALAQQRRG
jgi:hypothetical protein